MTTILPSARTGLEALGDLTGQRLHETLPGAVQRYQGLNAIDQLQTALQQANGDISKILPAIAKAYTLNPALERSGIAEQALLRAKTNIGTGALDQAINPSQGAAQGLPTFMQPQGQPGQTKTMQGQPAQPQTVPSPSSEGIFLHKALPLDLGSVISPEQKAKILQNVGQQGGDVPFTRTLIDDYNQGKISQNELENANVGKKAANVQRMLGFEDQIKERINQQLPKDASEAEKNIYYNMIRPALEGSESFSDAWQKVAADVDNFRKLQEGLIANIPESGSTLEGLSPDQSQIQRKAASPFLAQDPLAYNILEQAWQKKGHSPITVSKTFKPLPDPVKKTIGQAGDYLHDIYPLFSATTEFPEKAMMRNIDRADEAQQKDLIRLVPQLRKEWNEDISLLNIYSDLRAKGWMPKNISTLFDDLSDKFGSRQNAERGMITQNLRIPLRYLNIPGVQKE